MAPILGKKRFKLLSLSSMSFSDRVFPYKDGVEDSVIILKNAGHRKPVFCHIFWIVLFYFKYKGFPSKFTTKEDLKTLLLRFLWLTVHHAASNYPLLPYGGYVPIAPLKVFDDPTEEAKKNYAYHLPNATFTLVNCFFLDQWIVLWLHVFSFSTDFAICIYSRLFCYNLDHNFLEPYSPLVEVQSQVKQNLISSKSNLVYKVPHKFPNDSWLIKQYEIRQYLKNLKFWWRHSLVQSVCSRN